jgi:hypothetical protein
MKYKIGITGIAFCHYSAIDGIKGITKKPWHLTLNYIGEFNWQKWKQQQNFLYLPWLLGQLKN